MKADSFEMPSAIYEPPAAPNRPLTFVGECVVWGVLLASGAVAACLVSVMVGSVLSP